MTWTLRQQLLHAKNYSKHFTKINLLSCIRFCIRISQTRKQTEIGQDHKSCKLQSQCSNPGSLAPESTPLIIWSTSTSTTTMPWNYHNHWYLLSRNHFTRLLITLQLLFSYFPVFPGISCQNNLTFSWALFPTIISFIHWGTALILWC